MDEMPRYVARMIRLLRELRAHLEASQESTWSPTTPAENIAWVDEQLAALEARGELPGRAMLELLFLPTADLQELAMDSGWGQAYLDLANRFDEALREWPG